MYDIFSLAHYRSLIQRWYYTNVHTYKSDRKYIDSRKYFGAQVLVKYVN